MNPNPSPSKPDDRFIQESLERRQAEKTLRLVLQGASGIAGKDFFRLLIQYLAAALEVDLAFVAEFLPAKHDHARIIAIIENEKFDEPFEYPLAGTPCEHVLRDQKAYFAGSVISRFPDDPWLVEHNIESYHGVPLLDATGDPIGHLGVMHTQPMPMTIPREAVLRVFAARAGAELDRQRATEHLQQSVERFRSLVDALRLGVQEMTVDGTITFANRAHERMFGYAPDQMAGMTIMDLMVSDADRESVSGYLQTLVKETPPATPYFAKNLTKSGKVIEVRVDWNYRRGLDGRVIGFTSIVSEVDSPAE